MSFIFNTAIPAAPNNPSVDQPDMLSNNIATNGILAVDHVSFNTNFGGNHLQVHLSQYSTSNAVVNGANSEGSVVYSAAGVADAAHAQLNFKNPNGTFLLSGIRAFALCDNTGAIIASQSLNITSITHLGVGKYEVLLTANSVTLDKFLILVSSRQSPSGTASTVGNYVITGNAKFQIQFGALPFNGVTPYGLIDPAGFSFVVIQI